MSQFGVLLSTLLYSTLMRTNQYLLRRKSARVVALIWPFVPVLKFSLYVVKLSTSTMTAPRVHPACQTSIGADLRRFQRLTGPHLLISSISEPQSS